MRNLKKILALVLALVMSFSLMATANAFTDDKDIDPTFDEAVEVLSALKVFQGYENGSFLPKGDITRAEVATIIYRIVTGDVADKQVGLYADYNKFDDVKSGSWYAGYVNFCANAEIVKGRTAKTFDPNGKVTGYEALAMILRAIGYDKNDEFTGSSWQVQTAAVGKKLGITDNITAGTLGTTASREVVAEILFQTILVPQVEYTVAFGYQSYGQNTLGYETFKLVGAVSGADKWGRPAKVWKLDKDSDKIAEASDNTLVSLAYTPAASYTTAVDECDIAKDLGISSTQPIEAAFIDGEEYNVTRRAVTTNLSGTINPRATTSYVGAQGRLTEVYDMGVKGYRIVEINTYLAKAAQVVAEKVDKNGHVTAAYVNFEVYADNYSIDVGGAITANTVLKYETSDFVVGEYALVTVCKGSNGKVSIASTEKTAPVATGILRGYTAATTTVGEENYNDADKFVLNNLKTTANYGKTYDVFVDQYGNVIGLVETTRNYLVIEAIRWIHDGTLYGGSALANVVLADGSRVENVTIASVYNRLVTNTGDAYGDADSATVSDYYTNNGEYYNHLASYVVNTDGTYSITSLKDDTSGNDNDTVCGAADLTNVTITKGLTTMQNSTNKVVANDNTVFLVKNLQNGTYETYVGKNNVPSMTNATICYLTNAAGYATVVLVTNYTLAANTFVAYVPTETTAYQNTNWYQGVYNGKYAYDVYKLGETTPTTIYSADADLFGGATAGTAAKDGFYEIKVDANMVVANKTTDVTHFMGTYDTDTMGTAAGTHAGYTWDRAWVKTNLIGNSLQTADKAGTTPNKDFFVDDAKYFKVEKVTLPMGNTITYVTEGSAADMVAGTKVIVAYTNVANNPAAYVYAILSEGEAVNPAQDKYQVNNAAGYAVTVNNAFLAAVPNYTNTAVGTAKDALAGAVANATELSLKTLPYATVGTANYTINATNTSNGAIYVFYNAEAIPATLNSGAAATTADAPCTWNGTLGIGYYVVIADAGSTNAEANYYQVYKIVE